MSVCNKPIPKPPNYNSCNYVKLDNNFSIEGEFLYRNDEKCVWIDDYRMIPKSLKFDEHLEISGIDVNEIGRVRITIKIHDEKLIQMIAKQLRN